MGDGPKKRGRPRKAGTEGEEKKDTIPATVARESSSRKRGRPFKSEADASLAEHDKAKRSKLDQSAKNADVKAAQGKEAFGVAERKAGRTAKGTANAKTPPTKTATSTKKGDAVTEGPSIDELEDEYGRRFWLMKAEPESRIDKGHAVKGEGVDVAFSIDDLAAKKEPEPWTGVRNLVASRNMRRMDVGDLAFFYHSSCKVPGVAGIMEIVEEATADAEAFDEASPYYDSKSSLDDPKWMCVSVEFKQKMPNYVDLKTLRSHGDGELKGMELLRQSRLSVSKVTKAQWDFIMGLAGAEPVPPHKSINAGQDDSTSIIDRADDGTELVDKVGAAPAPIDNVNAAVAHMPTTPGKLAMKRWLSDPPSRGRARTRAEEYARVQAWASNALHTVSPQPTISKKGVKRPRSSLSEVARDKERFALRLTPSCNMLLGTLTPSTLGLPALLCQMKSEETRYERAKRMALYRRGYYPSPPSSGVEDADEWSDCETVDELEDDEEFRGARARFREVLDGVDEELKGI